MRGSTAERISTTMTNPEATADTKPATAAQPRAHVAPEKGASKKAASQQKRGPKANHGASKHAAMQAPKPAVKKAPKPATEAREGSKKATILELMRRPKGATLTEIAKATHWQNHSIRGFISGTLNKKMSLTVESSQNEAGLRTHRIPKERRHQHTPPTPPGAGVS